MRKRILSLVLALAIALPSAFIPALALTTAGLDKQRETEHFVFYCKEQDVEALDDLEKSFEGCYDRVTAELGKIPKEKTNVYIYPDIKTFHVSTDKANAPDSSVGEARNGQIYMVSPLNPGSVHGYDAIITVAVHEYVHVLIGLFGRRQPSYLDEGVACYMAGQPTTKSAVQKDIADNALPSLSTLESLQSFSNSRYNIYDYGYAYVDFVVKNFGFDKIIALLEGKSRNSVLDMTTEELNKEWLAFLEEEFTDHPDAPNLDKADSWAKDEINSAVRKGFVPAELQDDYKKIITREQFCQMAVMYLEYATGKKIDKLLSEKGLETDPNTFADTSSEYILAASALGITNGSGQNAAGADIFAPQNSITREMAAAMLTRLSKILGKDTENAENAGYTDISEASDWAENSINFCKASGVMTGTSEVPLKFSPKETYTIQQAIATFNRMK